MLAALFDLDGVLIDTEGIYTEIWNDIEKEYPTGVENFALRIKGNTLPNILATYYPDAKVQRKVVQKLKDSEEKMEYRIFDGVIEFLVDLCANDISAAIVTSSNNAKMQRLFEALPRFKFFFDTIITDADVRKGKPNPECYLTAASRLGVAPDKCVVFEDSFAGLKAGRAAGASVVALATTNSKESLEGQADLIISSFREIKVKQLIEDYGL